MDRFRRRFPRFLFFYVEHSGATIPLLVHQIVLRVAHPARCEDFGVLPGAGVLRLCFLCNPREDQRGILSQQMPRKDFAAARKFIAQRFIARRCPHNILFCGSVQQKLLEHQLEFPFRDVLMLCDVDQAHNQTSVSLVFGVVIAAGGWRFFQ